MRGCRRGRRRERGIGFAVCLLFVDGEIVRDCMGFVPWRKTRMGSAGRKAAIDGIQWRRVAIRRLELA